LDRVDFITEQWQRELPNVDITALVVWGRLKRASALLDRRLAIAMREHGLNIGEFEVLAALRRSGPPYRLRPSELTQSLIITPGAVTSRLDALERRRFIRRTRHADDRRGQIVQLTDAGQRVFDGAFASVLDECERTLAPLGKRRNSLRTVLGVFLKSMDDDDH
jgi:DNA-binding MarR family transcriptional regulator